MNATPSPGLRPFEVIPAIDLIGGRVVRLQQGSYDEVTEYSHDPVATAVGFWDAGATTVHVIDLDAARSGARSPEHRRIIDRLCALKPSGARLQVGGGFRGAALIDEAAAQGVDRIIVGTLAFGAAEAFQPILEQHAERIVVGADARDGTVRVGGWLDDSGLDAVAAVAALDRRGARMFLATGIDRDGTGEGVDVGLMRRLRGATDGLLLASGGVGTIAHVLAARDSGADGVVVGKALLSGAIRLEQALAAVGV